MRYLTYTLSLFCLFGIIGAVHAQLTDALPQTEINIEMTPEIPGPNEMVYVSLTSYSTNLNSANITWTLNGKEQKSGIGEKAFSFKTAEENSATELVVSILTQVGETIEKVITIKPVSVDLIWESEALTPPFYKGKTLHSHQNKISLVALPHILSSGGGEIPAKNLIYTWKKNGSVIENSSGFGKNTYSFVSPLMSRPSTISVEVTTLDSSGVGRASVFLTPSTPTILLYKKDPLDGIRFQSALLDNIELGISREIIVVGFPLFFGKSGLIYKWKINGVPTNNYPNQYTQVFRQEEGVSGVSQIGLSVENSAKILQYASANFNLVFNNQ